VFPLAIVRNKEVGSLCYGRLPYSHLENTISVNENIVYHGKSFSTLLWLTHKDTWWQKSIPGEQFSVRFSAAVNQVLFLAGVSLYYISWFVTDLPQKHYNSTLKQATIASLFVVYGWLCLIF